MAKAALVIMAAGMGSRYGGNKQVDGVGPNGEFLMQYGVFDAVRAGFDKIVFIIKPEILDLIRSMCGNMVEKLTTPDGRKVEVAYAYQTYDSIPKFYHIPEERTKPFGTCHAILCAKDVVNEPFCVINADDYYGVDAYRTIYEELMRLPKDGNATMVGYLLKNTVTEHGTVSRGVCQTKDGHLTFIKETLKIQLFPDGSIADIDSGERVDLPGDTVVSMNFWGFMPSIFPVMEQYFEDFLRNAGDNIKAECLLPNMVGDLIHQGKLQVSVLSSKDRWFGMTYHEDRAMVADELKRLQSIGVYPAKLAD